MTKQSYVFGGAPKMGGEMIKWPSCFHWRMWLLYHTFVKKTYQANNRLSLAQHHVDDYLLGSVLCNFYVKNYKTCIDHTYKTPLLIATFQKMATLLLYIFDYSNALGLYIIDVH